MKILYITPDITDSGGIARVLSTKLNYLVSKLDYEICILSVNDGNTPSFYEFNSKIIWFNIKETSNRFLFLWQYVRFIKKTIAATKPDVIVYCDSVLWLFIPWLVKPKLPTIFETHFTINFIKQKHSSFYQNWRSKIIVWWRKKTIQKFDTVVFLTQAESDNWKLKNSNIIPNPVAFLCTQKAVLHNPKAMAVCVNPYVKGLDRLLQIWSETTKNFPNWTLDIYGKWEENKSFLKLASDLQIADKVNFLPLIKTIENAYQQSSLFLLTSRYEAFPMVLIEAMNHGLPCIAFDCPVGPAAIIENEVNGFLVEDGNQDLFAQKLALLMQNSDLRSKMGANAQESIKKYKVEIVMQKWEKFFLDFKRGN